MEHPRLFQVVDLREWVLVPSQHHILRHVAGWTVVWALRVSHGSGSPTWDACRASLCSLGCVMDAVCLLACRAGWLSSHRNQSRQALRVVWVCAANVILGLLTVICKH